MSDVKMRGRVGGERERDEDGNRTKQQGKFGKTKENK